MGFSLEDLKKGTSHGLTVNNRAGLEVLKNSLQPISGNNLENRINNMAASVLPQAATVLKESSTRLIFFFDKSSSCSGTEKATISGFNVLIAKEKRSGFPTTVSTILFDNDYEIIHDRLDIKRVNSFNYLAKGGTALYDCLCDNLSKIIKEDEVARVSSPKKTIVTIMTDGNDEHSIYYDLRDTKEIISKCKALGFEFIFLGNGIDAKKEAGKLGIDASHAENYRLENNGILLNFRAVSNVLRSIRANGKIDPNWAAPILNNNLALGDGIHYSDDDSTLRLGGKK